MAGKASAPVLVLVFAALAWGTLGCTDAKAVNAAFVQGRVTWFVFDPEAATGLHPLPGFDQALKVTWKPRPWAVRATGVTSGPVAGTGLAAVSHLGLVVLDDSTGEVSAFRPGARFGLSSLRTLEVGLWQGRAVVALAPDTAGGSEPAALAWWTPGQERLALIPVPSLLQHPDQQLLAAYPLDPSGTPWRLVWQVPGARVTLAASDFDLTSGEETSVPPEAVSLARPETPWPTALAAARRRIADRLGAEVPVLAAIGGGPPLAFTATGWAAVGSSGQGPARLYRLPDLGAAGQYTGAVALERGWVFTWEMAYRAHVGASGLVHIPFGVLAPGAAP